MRIFKTSALLLIAFFTLTIVSCGKKTSSFESIVKSEDNIAAVGQFNLQQIMDKGDFWKEFAFVNLMIGDQIDSTKWGTNLFSKKKFLLTADEQNNPHFVIIEFGIESKEKFEEKLTSLLHAEVSTEDGYNLITNPANENATIAWNDNSVIIVAGKNHSEKSSEKIKAIIKAIKTPSKKKLNQDILEAINSTKDASFVAYTQKINWEGIKKEDSKEISELLKDSYLTASINGEAGAIEFNAQTFGMEDFLNSKHNIIAKQGASKEMIEKILTDNLLGFLSISLDGEQISEFLASNSAEMKSDKEELVKKYAPAFDGSLVIGLKNIDMNGETPPINAIAGIKDVALLNQFLDTFPPIKRLDENNWVAIENSIEDNSLDMEITEKEIFYLRLDNNQLIMSADKDFVNNNDGNTNSDLNIDMASENPFYLYVNAENLNSEIVPNEAIEILKSIQYANGSSNVKDSFFKIKFKNEKENGWKQLFKALGGQVMNMM